MDNKIYNGYVEEKDETYYPTCHFCGNRMLPDAIYNSQEDADEAAALRCDCFDARKYQDELDRAKKREENIIKLRQRLDDFTDYSNGRGVELAGDLYDLLLSVGTAVLDAKILKATINVGRIKVNFTVGSKSALAICFTYSDGAKLEV